MLKDRVQKSGSQKNEEFYGPEETDQRTRAIVRAAAKTLPVPLKAIPKKFGGKRKLRPAKKRGA